VISSIAISIPSYWLGIVLVIVFSVELNWFPAMGMGPSEAWAWDLERDLGGRGRFVAT
jgi:peptide/nickel transport system permease protein